jgi:hypothetical protein
MVLIRAEVVPVDHFMHEQTNSRKTGVCKVQGSFGRKQSSVCICACVCGQITLPNSETKSSSFGRLQHLIRKRLLLLSENRNQMERRGKKAKKILKN